MGVVLEKMRDMRKHLLSTPPRIEKLSHPQHGGHPAFDHVGEWRFSTEHWIRIWQLNPTITQFLAVKNVECLKDACEQGDPRQAVLIKHSRTRFFQFVVRAVRYAAE